MGLSRQSLLVSIASLVAAVVGYFFNPLFIAPILGPEGIAVLGTFLYLNFALSFPQRPVDTTLTRFISESHAAQKPGQIAYMIRGSLKRLSFYGLLLGVLFFCLSPWLQQYLRLTSTLPIFAAILLAYAGLLLTVLRAPFQGLLRFNEYSLILLAEPVSRLVIGGLLVRLGMGIEGAMLGYLGGYFAAMGLSLWFLKDVISSSKEEAVNHLEMVAYSIPVWIYAVYLALTLSLDGLLVKHYFSDTEAGIYMAASTLAKMIFVAITPLGVVSFSFMCNAAGKNRRLGEILVKSLALTLGSCGLVATVCFLFSPVVVGIAYGKQFASAALLLPYLVLALMPLCLNFILSNYYLAKKTSSFVYGLLMGVALQFLLIIFFHQNLIQVIIGYGLGGVLQCLLAVSFDFFKPLIFRKTN